jgi:hypothetical protein
MTKEEGKVEFAREPFVPLRIHLMDGRQFNIPFREMTWLLGYGVLVFKGMKPGSRQAKGFDQFPFEKIQRIEQRPARVVGKRRKAS